LSTLVVSNRNAAASFAAARARPQSDAAERGHCDDAATMIFQCFTIEDLSDWGS